MFLQFIKNMFKKPWREHDDVWTRMETIKAIRRNGVITERARIEKRSLSLEERNIVFAIREIAKMKGFSQKMINMEELDGQKDKQLIYEPYRVKARFAYFTSPYFGHPVADPSFIIMESNHPLLIKSGNFGEEELKKFGVRIPKHPTFDEWDRQGRPCYRGN